MSDEPVRYRVDDGVAVVTIARPARMNALDAATRAALLSALATLDADSEARVGVLTGEGVRAFCAGGDLAEVVGPEEMLRFASAFGAEKPLVAAVNGVAYGAGFLLAQACDLVVASATARFAIPETKIGRSAAWAAGLPSWIPPRAAMELLLTGDPVGARRAYELGLVNEVVPAANLMAAALALAGRVAERAPLAVLAAKRMTRLTADLAGHRVADELAEIWRPVRESADADEGVAAFLEKRRPRWTGK